MSLVVLVRLTTYPERIFESGNAPEVFVKRVFWIFEEGRGVTYITELDISELDDSCGFPASAVPKRKEIEDRN